MKLLLVSIADKQGSKELQLLATGYHQRIGAFSSVEPLLLRSEDDLFRLAEKSRVRTNPLLVLLDSRGKQFTSGQFAEWMGRQRDQGQQTMIFAIGPADGWSDEARKRANLLLSLGPMTLPHELARVVLSEQIYRAFTILSGHPYHTGH
jgi:23S rRNA (pseudouridine1915-N3)-methyltransferase